MQELSQPLIQGAYVGTTQLDCALSTALSSFSKMSSSWSEEYERIDDLIDNDNPSHVIKSECESSSLGRYPNSSLSFGRAPQELLKAGAI